MLIALHYIATHTIARDANARAWESDGLKIEIWTKDDENIPVSTIITTTAFFVDGGKKRTANEEIEYT